MPPSIPHETAPADGKQRLVRLIVNADDFGLSASVNRAVVTAHRRGLLTSCSLMVTSPGFEEAAALAAEAPGLAVGLHLVALHGRPLLCRERWSPWVARGGAFSSHPVAAGLALYALPSQRRLARREVRAQFERFAETGLPLSHVDGHLHFHVHPVLFDEAVSQAMTHGAAGIRVPRDDLALHRAAQGRAAAAERAYAAVFAAINRRCLRRLEGAALRAPDRCLGTFRSGRLDEGYLTRLLRGLPPGLTEVHLHPDDGGRPPWGDRELAALLSPRLRSVLEERGVVLTTYAGG